MKHLRTAIKTRSADVFGTRLRGPMFEQGVLQEHITKMEEALGLMPRLQIVTADSEQKQQETSDGND